MSTLSLFFLFELISRQLWKHQEFSISIPVNISLDHMVWTKFMNEVLQSSQQHRIFCAWCLNFSFAGEDVVFIANDWHTALIPCYLKSMYQSVGIYKNARVGLNHTGLLFYTWSTYKFFKFSLWLLLLPGCSMYPQHCLPRKICIRRLCTSKPPWPI